MTSRKPEMQKEISSTLNFEIHDALIHSSW